MKYYLLTKGNEMVIDYSKREGWEVDQEIDADSWIEAKKKAGFELTIEQEIRLQGRK